MSVGNPQDLACRRFHQLKPGHLVDALPLAQGVDDVLDLLVLVLGALSGVHRGNVQDGLFRRVQHLQDVVGITAGIKEITNVQPLQPLIAVELFVIGIGHGIELALVIGRQHGLGVTPEIAAGHGDNMHPVTRDHRAQMRAQLVVGVGRDVVEFVHRDQPIIERLDTILFDGEPEGGVGADQNLVGAGKKRAKSADRAAVTA